MSSLFFYVTPKIQEWDFRKNGIVRFYHNAVFALFEKCKIYSVELLKNTRMQKNEDPKLKFRGSETQISRIRTR